MRRPNYIIVLNALMNEPGSRTVLLPSGIEVGWVNDKLHHIMYSSNGPVFDKDNCEQIWYEFDFPLNAFVAECNRMSEEDIFGISAVSTLRKARQAS